MAAIRARYCGVALRGGISRPRRKGNGDKNRDTHKTSAAISRRHQRASSSSIMAYHRRRRLRHLFGDSSRRALASAAIGCSAHLRIRLLRNRHQCCITARACLPIIILYVLLSASSAKNSSVYSGRLASTGRRGDGVVAAFSRRLTAEPQPKRRYREARWKLAFWAMLKGRAAHRNNNALWQISMKNRRSCSAAIKSYRK